LKNSSTQAGNGAELLTKIIMYENSNLFEYLFHSINEVVDHLKVNKDKLLASSSLGDFTYLRSQERVVAICKALNADQYVNPISGSHLYQSERFERENIELKFFEPHLPQVENQGNAIPYSIVHSIFNFSEKDLSAILSKGTVKNAA